MYLLKDMMHKNLSNKFIAFQGQVVGPEKMNIQPHFCTQAIIMNDILNIKKSVLLKTNPMKN